MHCAKIFKPNEYFLTSQKAEVLELALTTFIKEYKYPMIDANRTGEWLRYLCKRKNITVAEIQEKLQITSNQAIYAWFGGKTLPSLNNLYALSELLGMPMDDMIVDNVHEHPFFRYVTLFEKRLILYNYRIMQAG